MRNFMQNELAQAVVAVVLLVIAGLLYAGMLHHERAQEERLRAAGIDILQMIREAR